MTETDGTSTGVAGDSSPAPTRVVSSVVKVGERTKFTVELRPGETTIVSWKKLTKDAAKSECGVETTAPSVVATAAAPTTVAAASEIHAAALDARVAPGGPVSNEDAPAPNRFSAVIEKIERLYKGKDSSDEEDLDDIPDDDQYDTEDSFIDDAELDEYFQVDKSKTKHDGYFVNRGMLEKVIESPELPNQQPKKRRRKEMAKVAGNNDDGLHPSKHMKALKEGTGKYLSNEKGVLPISEGSSVKYFEETKIHIHQKIADDGKPLLDPTLRIPHDDGSLTLAEISDNQKADIFPDKHLSSKLKEVNGNGDRIESKHKAHSVINNYEESEIAVHQKDSSPMREKIDLNLPDTKHSVQPVKSSVTHKKESSSAKSKVNVLEKAIRELEKMVAESRPPALDAQDGDSSSLCIKRRLPREIKHKLAKVARLAHASNGNVSNELLNRLMGIVGHLCQVRTLKRHLKIMVTTSLSAKQEKDEKFQVIKEEVVKMVNACVPSGIYKATEQQSGGSGDIQESSEKAATGQLFMNASLEDKICDLYDIFVDGLDEDAAPQVRKLYAELAELWPKGFMDNHGIKLAICRAKERRRTLVDTNKDHEKIKRKKLVATNTENTVNVESNLAAPSQYLNMNVTTDPSITAVTHQFSSTSFKVQAFTSLTNVPISHRPNQEKVTVTHPSSLSDVRMVDGIRVRAKKKAKKKAENLVGDVHMLPEKFSLHQVDQQTQHKHPAVHLQGGSQKSSYDTFPFGPLT